MAAADPSYPLYPVASISCAACLLVLFMVNIVRFRQSYNLAINLLCFCLFWETLSYGINTILWSDNADLKAFAYCDVVSHLQIFTFIVKPACTLIITRQLYNIATLRSAHYSPEKQRRTDLAFELTIGIGLPALITGPLYYIVQTSRFTMIEAFGCTDALNASGLSVILIYSWLILLPLFSVLYYCPKIVMFFYQRRKAHGETSETASGSSRHFRGDDIRVLVLGCIDIVLSLPFGILNLVIRITGEIQETGSFRFYDGWAATHAHWEPFPITYAELKLGGPLSLFNFYFSPWSSVILGFSIFALFGLTKRSRATYANCFWAALGLFGKRKPAPRLPARLSAIQFDPGNTDAEARPDEFDAELLTSTTSDSIPPKIGIGFGFDPWKSASEVHSETDAEIRNDELMKDERKGRTI